MAKSAENLSQVGTKRTVWIEDELWTEAMIAAGERGAKEGYTISVSELVRRGLRRELIAHLQPEWYRRPPHVRAIMRAYREDPEGKLIELRKAAPNP